MNEDVTDTLLDMAVLSLITLILYEEENNVNKEIMPTPVKAGDGPQDRGCKPDQLSAGFNTAFQQGYQKESTGQTDTKVSEVPGPESARDD